LTTPPKSFLNKNIAKFPMNILGSFYGPLINNGIINEGRGKFSSSSTKEITDCTIWNKQLGLSSIWTKPRLTNQERAMLVLTPRVRSMLVGLLLSDAWLQSTNSNIKTPRIGLKQSIVNLPFLLSIYSELGYLCSTKVMCHISKIRGVAYTSFSFQTRALPCFIELYDLFIGPEKVKRISPELYDYLDYKALAF
jgi:hypothetical protein